MELDRGGGAGRAETAGEPAGETGRPGNAQAAPSTQNVAGVSVAGGEEVTGHRCRRPEARWSRARAGPRGSSCEDSISGPKRQSAHGLTSFTRSWVGGPRGSRPHGDWREATGRPLPAGRTDALCGALSTPSTSSPAWRPAARCSPSALKAHHRPRCLKAAGTRHARPASARGFSEPLPPRPAAAWRHSRIRGP